MKNTDVHRLLYYAVKPFVPRSAQLAARRLRAQYKLRKCGHIWPIDPVAAEKPAGWHGWPDGNRFGVVLSHDVDTARGYDNVRRLSDLEEDMGLRSQFNFVPERYGEVQVNLLDELKSRGFGVGIHGLKHDGKLFNSKQIFDERAPRINEYMKRWGTTAFTAPSMIRNHEWMHQLDIDYCVSTFDTDPFEPQSDGAATIFPYWVEDESSDSRFLELPYTLAQDFTLYVILGERTNDRWKQKLDWIAENGGMALLNSHPDYMDFDTRGNERERYPIALYRDFLQYIKDRYEGRYWHALPRDVWNFAVEQFPSKSAGRTPK